MSGRKKSRQGTCSVKNEQILEEMKHEAEDYVSQSDPTACSSRKYSVRGSSAGSRQSLVEELMKQNMEQQRWIDEKRITDIQAKADRDARDTRQMYESMLRTEDTFVQEMHDFVAKKEMLNQRKRELLHKKWTENVNEPLRQQVVTELNSPNYDEYVRRKRELYKEYLEHTNRKGHVFLDVIAADEYYPLALHPTRPSLLTPEYEGRPTYLPLAATPKLNDPTLQAERDRCDEDRVVLRCLTGYSATDRDLAAISLPPLPLRPLGRHGTNCSTWSNMRLGDIESIDRRRMYGNYNRSDPSIATWITHPPRPPKERTPPPPQEDAKLATPPSWSQSNMVPEEPVEKPPVAPIDSGTEIRQQPSIYTRKLIGPAPVVAL